VKAAE